MWSHSPCFQYAVTHANEVAWVYQTTQHQPFATFDVQSDIEIRVIYWFTISHNEIKESMQYP